MWVNALFEQLVYTVFTIMVYTPKLFKFLVLNNPIIIGDLQIIGNKQLVYTMGTFLFLIYKITADYTGCKKPFKY